MGAFRVLYALIKVIHSQISMDILLAKLVNINKHLPWQPPIWSPIIRKEKLCP
jgi:hypothetical protein